MDNMDDISTFTEQIESVSIASSSATSATSATSLASIIVVAAMIVSCFAILAIVLSFLLRPKITITKICPPGHVGVSCETKCRSGSTASSNIPGKGRCLCKDKYAGPTCEMECGDSSLTSRPDNEGIYRCLCPDEGGWSADCRSCTDNYYGPQCNILKFPYAYGVMLDRAVDFYKKSFNPEALEPSCSIWVKSQNPNGKWDDCLYGATASGAINGSNYALRRIHWIAQCLVNESSEYYQDPEFKTAIVNGLDFWINSKTTNPNWWFATIGFPNLTGIIATLITSIQPFYTEEWWLKVLNSMGRYKATSYDGANALDITLNVTLRAMVQQDATSTSEVITAKNYVDRIMGDNFMTDGMYVDHGIQIQISSYGEVFCKSIMLLFYLYTGTPLQFNKQNKNTDLIIDFVKTAQIGARRFDQIDFGTIGRQVSRKNGLSFRPTYLSLMPIIDPRNANIYLDAIKRQAGSVKPSYNVAELNRYYWSTDYMMHARKNFLFTTRCVSKRTVESETGNDENLKANYFSYGSTYISVDGKEYMNIQPIWDWCKIPGTTYPYTTSFPKRPDWGNNNGNTTFVGGLSNGQFGVSTLHMNQVNLNARKSWFFFEQEIVCLGAGITYSANNNPVCTTVNQEYMIFEGYCTYGEHGSSEDKQSGFNQNNIYSNDNLKWVHHKQVGYVFPESGSPLNYTLKKQSGTWKSINADYGDEVESGFVFSLWYNHGANPTNAAYAYIVVPGINNLTSEIADGIISDLEILSNTDTIQAVLSCSNSCLQIVFNQAGTLNLDSKLGLESIIVTEPCIMMMVAPGSFYISDPTQLLREINVKITATNGTVLIDDAINLPEKVGAFDYRGSTLVF